MDLEKSRVLIDPNFQIKLITQFNLITALCA